MRQGGFSLAELLTTIAITGILLAMAVLNYNSMLTKASIESEAATIYSNLIELRLQALYSKSGRSAVISGKQFSIYSSQVTSVAPVSVIALAYPVAVSPDAVLFDAGGLMAGPQRSICIDPSGALAANAGNVDSVVLSAAKTHLGKREPGGACDPSAIDQK